jgi:hypothetical protein
VVPSAYGVAAAAVVGEYRYNRLNQRIAWHYDIDADADTDSSDNWLYFVHDDRWRIVATFRGNGAGTTVDATPRNGSYSTPRKRPRGT